MLKGSVLRDYQEVKIIDFGQDFAELFEFLVLKNWLLGVSGPG